MQGESKKKSNYLIICQGMFVWQFLFSYLLLPPLAPSPMSMGIKKSVSHTGEGKI
jgi:hypothetical protein